MAALDVDRKTIIKRLKREGWILRKGRHHAILTNRERPGVVIIVPATYVSVGVARHIAKAAGWIT